MATPDSGLTRDADRPFDPRAGSFPAWEAAGLLALLALFLAANGLTAPYQAAWVDEVAYIDPAVRWLAGRGFTSTVWFQQPRDHFWAGNVPLYAWTMTGWLGTFGVSPLVVRWFHYLAFAAAAGLAWLGLRRHGVIRSPCLRLATTVAWLVAPNVALVYRSAHYDSAQVLVAAALFAATSIRPKTLCRVVCLALAACVPLAGLQLTVAMLVWLALWTLYWRGAWRDGLVVLTGLVAGGMLLLALYASQGVLCEFLAALRGTEWLNTRRTSILGTGLGEKLANLPSVPLYRDLTLGMSAVLLAASAAHRVARRDRAEAGFLWLGAAGLLVVPLAVYLLGKFEAMYFWLTVVPVVICVAAELDRRAWPRWLATGLWGALVAVNLFLGLAASCLGDWRLAAERDLRRWPALFAPHVEADDHLFCDPLAYYACWPRVEELYVWTFLPALRAEERERINVLILRPRFLPEVTAALGGAWRETGRLGIYGREPEELVVARRLAAPDASSAGASAVEAPPRDSGGQDKNGPVR